MSKTVHEAMIKKFQKLVEHPDGTTAFEFTMTDTWHDRLRDEGCFEIVDFKGGLIGFAVSPEYAQTLVELATGTE